VDDLAFLNTVPLFSGIPSADLNAIHRMCRPGWHAAGSVILRQDEPSADLYIIREGEVVVRLRRNGSDRELVRLGPGSVFGEMALFDGYPRSASIIALTEVLSFCIKRADFASFAERRSSVLFQMCKVFSHRLRDTNSLLTKR
jgi:CRP/FNR family cyclic AMP-dependent transcriptional regulator